MGEGMEARFENFGIVSTQVYDPSRGHDGGTRQIQLLDVTQAQETKLEVMHYQTFAQSFAVTGKIKVVLSLLARVEDTRLLLHSSRRHDPKCYMSPTSCQKLGSSIVTF